MIPFMIYARGFRSTNEAYMPYQAMKQRLSVGNTEILFLCFVNGMQTTPPPLILIFQYSPILIGPWGSLSWLEKIIPETKRIVIKDPMEISPVHSKYFNAYLTY